MKRLLIATMFIFAACAQPASSGEPAQQNPVGIKTYEDTMRGVICYIYTSKGTISCVKE